MQSNVFKTKEKKGPTSVTVICWILGLSFIIFLFFPGSWVGPCLNIWAARRGVNLYAAPTERKIVQSKGERNDPKFSYFGIEFQVPWKKVSEQKTFGDNTILLKFPEEKAILLIDSPKSGLREALFQGRSPQEVNALKERLGTKEADFSSDYEFTKWFLSQTPGEINIFTPVRSVIARTSVLIAKMVMSVKTDKIYYFETEQLKGFQYGDPEQGKNGTISIEVYDNKDHRFIFAIQGTQDEIDSILSSVVSLSSKVAIGQPSSASETNGQQKSFNM